MSESNHQPDLATWLQPDWPASPKVHAWFSTRGTELSAGAFGAFNTADHVGDDPAHVASCREALKAAFSFQHDPLWLDQVHGVVVVDALPDTPRQAADAVTTVAPGLPVTIHTADCLPVFFCNRSATRIALAHAGWRGLCDGVIEATVARFTDAPADILVWLGPAIGPQHFEVGSEVRDAFIAHDPAATEAFRIGELRDQQRWLGDIYQLARQRLARLGITQVSGGHFCTVSEERFFSFRRDKVTGRMVSVMWLEH